MKSNKFQSIFEIVRRIDAERDAIAAFSVKRGGGGRQKQEDDHEPPHP